MVKRKEKVIGEISRSSQPTYRPVQLHFQKSLFIGTSSLFDWFEIISCKPQNYLFILFNGLLQRQRVQSNYMYQ